MITTARSAPEAHRHLAGLDVVRFMAAMMVMWFHYFAWSWLAAGSTGDRVLHHAAAYPILMQFSWFGWVGVQIFFVVSGFVIAFTAEQRTGGEFFRARVLRLVPAAWICATITLAVALAINYDWRPVLLVEFLRSVLFWPTGPYIDGVYWTLGVEIAFYALVFALLCINGFKRIEWLAVALGVWSGGFLFYAAFNPAVFSALPERLYELSLLRYGIYFALGVVLWACARHGVTLARLAFAGVLMLAAYPEIAQAHGVFMERMHLRGGVLVPYIVFLVGVTAIVISVAAHRLTLGARTLAVLRALGIATYPLYLIHQLVGAAVLDSFLHAGLGPRLSGVLAMATSIAAAILIAKYGEPPIRRVIRHAFDFAGQRFGALRRAH